MNVKGTDTSFSSIFKNFPVPLYFYFLNTVFIFCWMKLASCYYFFSRKVDLRLIKMSMWSSEIIDETVLRENLASEVYLDDKSPIL